MNYLLMIALFAVNATFLFKWGKELLKEVKDTYLKKKAKVAPEIDEAKVPEEELEGKDLKSIPPSSMDEVVELHKRSLSGPAVGSLEDLQINRPNSPGAPLLPVSTERLISSRPVSPGAPLSAVIPPSKSRISSAHEVRPASRISRIEPVEVKIKAHESFSSIHSDSG
eukprot:TRINITY_DN12267_c0_g1_i2.p1 TRINITY_DN12267_c0_g1~~TRINITY_DN12267_c0_g1_i2.p1  ORF type:complete len:168 (+),score=29.16 TRINITY_DN12267_c0_g1_i2:191-694(+)